MASDNDQRKPRFRRTRWVAGRLNPFSQSRASMGSEGIEGGRFIYQKGAELSRYIRNFSDLTGPNGTCPACGASGLIIKHEAVSIIPPSPERIIVGQNGVTSYGSHDTHPTLECEACGWTATAESIVSTPEARATASRCYKLATRYGWSTLIVGVSGSVLALTQQSTTTELGVLFLTAFTGLQAATWRYRGWQYEHKRLYEQHAPVSDWMQWELDRIKADLK